MLTFCRFVALLSNRDVELTASGEFLTEVLASSTQRTVMLWCMKSYCGIC